MSIGQRLSAYVANIVRAILGHPRRDATLAQMPVTVDLPRVRYVFTPTADGGLAVESYPKENLQ
jgi:hypothetical protein